MSLEKSIEARILKYMYSLEMNKKPERAYKREIARNIGVSERAAYTYLLALTEKGYIVASKQRGVQRFYKLTDTGRALAWALANPSDLAALFSTEETAKVGGKVESPEIKVDIERIYSTPLPIEVSQAREKEEFIEFSAKISKKLFEKLRKETRKIGKKR